jgi:hypothetical protein
MLRRLAAAVSAVAFALGGLWALAGTLRLVFGIKVTLALVPPLALDHVEVLPAFGMALGFTVLGALLGRYAHTGAAPARAATAHQVR